MDFRLTVFLCLVICIAALTSAYPSDMQEQDLRAKRDVMETMKNAWMEVVRTMSDAGDAIVHVFKPTEKSSLAKVGDEYPSLPTPLKNKQEIEPDKQEDLTTKVKNSVSGAGDAIIHVFKPTEKSVLTKMSEGMGFTK